MRLKVKLKTDAIIGILVVILFCSFTVLTTYEWGRYLMLACLLMIFILDALQNGLEYKFSVGRLVATVALFAVYALVSSVWAVDSFDAFEKSRTLFELLLMVFVLEHYYRGKENDVLTIIKWSSFVIVIYSILFYGLDALVLMAASEERMDNTYANVNVIGMLAAVGTTIQLDEILRDKKWKWAGLLCVPSVFLLAVTQSRKALAVLVAGCVMVFFLRSTDSRDFRKRILKVLIFVIVALVLLNLLLSLPIFDGTLKRIEKMFASFTGTGISDNSTYMRRTMIKIGFEQFCKTPLFGMGIGNPHLLTYAEMGVDTYLHNNFVELLAGGGIVGFCIYYSMYAYLFVIFWRYRKNRNAAYVPCLVLMSVFLLMDFGRVSYYNKMNYIYLLLYFLEAESLRKQAHGGS